MPDETVTDEVMASEPEAAEAVQPEETEVPEVAESDSPDTDQPEGDEPDGDAEPEDEEIELRYGSNALKIPKGALPDEEVANIQKYLKDTEADYTRKAQDAAEQRRAVEERAKALDHLSGLNEEVITEFSKGQQVKSEIERLQQVDLNQLWQSNPDQARQVSDRLSNLNAQMQDIVANVSKAEADLKTAQAQQRTRQIEEGKATIEKLSPGFTEKVPEVIDYVVNTFGIDRSLAEAEWSMNPATAIMAQKAMLYDRMQAKAVAKPAVKTATPIKPTRTKGGASAKNPDDMSVDEWLAWRNKQAAG